MKRKVKKLVRFVFSKNFFLLLCLIAQLAVIIFTYFIAGLYAPKILGSVFAIVAFIFALFINNSKQHHDIKLAYIMILVLFPLYGTLTYILALLGMGNRKFKKHLLRIDKQTAPILQNHDIVDSLPLGSMKGISNYLYSTCQFPIFQNTNCKYYSSGETQYIDMLEDLKNAKSFIFLEYYILREGEMLNTIIDILCQKQKEGVEVRLLYDGTSSIIRIPHSFMKRMNNLGIKCKMFMPVRAIISTEQNNRDHRKLCIIDNKISYTGGINLSDEYINKTHQYGYWKDCGVKICGEAVSSYTQMFLKMWNFKQKDIEDFDKYITIKATEESDGYYLPFSDHPHDGADVSKTVILQILATAKSYVHFTTPYLILDDELKDALCNAAKRGVDIKIITPNRPDKKITYCVTQSNYLDLIKSNVTIAQYEPGFIHAKSIVSDDNCAVLGTVNLDYRSLFLNFENSILIYKSSEIEKIENDFINTFNNSIIINYEKYKKINVFKRFVGRLLKIIAPLM